MHTITTRYIGILAIVAATVCCAPAYAAWHFTAIDFPGADVVETNVFGVNDSGDAVGYAFDVLSEFQIHPFSFVYDTRKGSYTRLPRAFGEEFGTFASGINNPGVIVGNFLNELGAPAYIRSKNGVYAAFMHPGSTFTNFRGINEHGVIAGHADDGDLLEADPELFGHVFRVADAVVRGVRPGHRDTPNVFLADGFDSERGG